MNNNIETMLGLKFPIYWNDWALEPAAVNLLIYKLITSRPKNIVELGSGLSTLITARVMKTLGESYTLTSIDSDGSFLEETKNRLLAEGLYDRSVIKFIEAPISRQKFGEDEYLWYDTSVINSVSSVNLLFVDGPIGSIGKMARYPAGMFFKGKLAEKATIILDDANRPDEREIIKRWTEELQVAKVIKREDTSRGIVEILLK